MEPGGLLIPTITKKDCMEQKYISNMNDMKRNENLTLKQVSEYWDKEKTKLQLEYHVDQFGKWQGEEKWWYENGQIWEIGNCGDGNLHGKFQSWWEDGRRRYIDLNHFKKGKHGTRIEFHHKKPNLFSQFLKYMNGIYQNIVYTFTSVNNNKNK